MPTIDTDATYGFVDKRLGRGSNTGDSPLANGTEGTYLDNEALDSTLGTIYTVAQISHMTKNDKVFAARYINDSPGLFRG